MRSEILRDVIAGSAGALAVAAVIGLPGKPTASQQPQFQPRQAVLLPYFRTLKPAVPVPPAPHTRITTGP
jgi:hypothetical protein